jgi:hypothetical protein
MDAGFELSYTKCVFEGCLTPEREIGPKAAPALRLRCHTRGISLLIAAGPAVVLALVLPSLAVGRNERRIGFRRDV